MELKHNPASHEMPTGHETVDASVRGIIYTGIGLAISTAIIIMIVYGIFQYLAEHPVTTAPSNPMAETDRQEFPPAPRIQEHPAVELQDLHTQEDQILNTYGWTDKPAGIVRIPLDRAMELQMERGFPTRKEAAKK